MIKVPEEVFTPLNLSFGLLALVFIIDAFVPLSAFGGMLYLMGMIGVIWFLKPQEIQIYGITSGVLALLAFFLSENPTANNGGLTSRIMAIFAMATIAVLIHRYTRVEQTLSEQLKQLTTVVYTHADNLKKVGNRLNEVRSRLAEAEELDHVGFWEYHLSKRQMVWSKGALSIYGFPKSSRSPSFEEFVERCHPEDLQIFQRSFQFGLTEKKTYTAEYRLLMPDGSQKWIYCRGRPVVDNRGRVEMLVGAIHDVTSRKQKGGSASAKVTSYLTVFKSAAIPKAFIIPAKRILEVNPAFCRWTGFSEEELLKIPIEKLMHTDDRDLEDPNVRDMIDGKASGYQKEKRFIRKDGQVIWGRYTLAPVSDAQGKLTSLAVEIVDITAQKRVEEERANAEQAWREAQKAADENKEALLLAEQALSEREAMASAEAADPHYAGEQGLTLAEEAINCLFALSSNLMALIDSEGYYRRVNNRLASKLGFKPEEMEDRLFLEFVREDDQTYVYKYLQRLVQGDQLSDIVLHHRTRLGLYEGLSMMSVYNDSHAVVYVVFEPVVQAQPPEEPFENLIPEAEPSLSTHFLVDEPHVSKRSGSLEAPFEREPEIGPPSFIEPEAESYPNLSDHILEDAPAVNWFEEDLTVDPISDGLRTALPPEPEVRTVGTSRRRATIDWRSLTDKMPFQIWMIDTFRLCRYANKKVRDFTGLPFEQLEGSGWNRALHAEDYRPYAVYYNEVFDLQRPMQVAYRLRRADGAYRWIQETAVPLYNEKNKFEGYLITGLEISALRAVRKIFAHALAGALHGEDLKSTLLQCSRDECKQALSDSIKVADALIENAREIPHPTLADLMAIAGQRLLDQVNNVLHFEGMSVDKLDIPMRDVPLLEVIEHTAQLLEPLRRMDEPRFEIVKGDPESGVMGERKLMLRIFEMLMQRLQNHAESRKVLVEIEEEEEMCVVVFRDLGPIFNSAFVDDPSLLYRSDKGLPPFLQVAGLEMLLIRRLTHFLGGDLRIEEDGPEGPVISIQFQKARSSQARQKSGARVGNHHARRAGGGDALDQLEDFVNHNRAAGARGMAGGQDEILVHENHNGVSRHRVLIGERSGEMQRLVRSLLQPYYDLTIVSDTDELLKKVDQGQYDLLLLDVQLKGGRHSGVELLEELRRRPGYIETPVVAVATVATPEIQSDLVDRAGFDGFLRKPYSIVELLETVERMTESRF